MVVPTIPDCGPDWLKLTDRYMAATRRRAIPIRLKINRDFFAGKRAGLGPEDGGLSNNSFRNELKLRCLGDYLAKTIYLYSQTMQHSMG